MPEAGRLIRFGSDRLSWPNDRRSPINRLPKAHRGRQAYLLATLDVVRRRGEEYAMRASWMMTVLLGLLVSLFAGIHTAAAQTRPTADERQALSPTGKLRVGFLLNNPVHATKDPVSGELRGVSIDIGRSSPVASMSRTTESATLQFQHWRQVHSLVNGTSSFSAPIPRAPS